MSAGLPREFLPRRTGCGIAVRGDDLVVAVVRAGATGVEVLGRTELRSFRERPPAEWGAEYSRLLNDIGQSHLTATLAIPRSEVVFRVLSLPPMGRSDLARAIELQLHDLHPYGDTPVYKSFTPISGATGRSSQHVAVAICEAPRIDAYARRLSEAGIAVAGCTVSADALRAATEHVVDAGHAPFLLADRHGSTLEVCGVSEDVPFLSSSLHLDGVALDGALRLAREGLSVPADRSVALAFLGAGKADVALPGIEAVPVEALVTAPTRQVEGFDLKQDAVAMGTAMLSVESRSGLGLNLVPHGARKRTSVAPLLPRLALGGALAVLALLLAILPTIQDWRYAERLRREAARLEESAAARAGDASDLAALQERYRWLLERRERIRSDLDAMREISEILPDSAWLTALRLERDKAVLTGMAAEADPLLSLLSSSPLLEQARFARSPTRSDSGERFQIEAQRR
jgi:Tfp pilus assembly protein PilN